MNYTDLSGKNAQELNELLKEKKTELFSLKMKKQTMQLQNTSELRIATKDIAKINTALSALNK